MVTCGTQRLHGKLSRIAEALGKVVRSAGAGMWGSRVLELLCD